MKIWPTFLQALMDFEHYCTNATQVIMAQLYPQLFNGSRHGMRLLAACVQDD
jgi:hypothetical protein